MALVSRVLFSGKPVISKVSVVKKKSSHMYCSKNEVTSNGIEFVKNVYLAAFLVRLVEPNAVTASVRTSLKSISGNASGMQLAARHCFILEDPTDEKRKSADSQRVVAKVVGVEGKKDENQNDNKEEKSSLVFNIYDSPNDEENEKNRSSLIEEKELSVSPNGVENGENSDKKEAKDDEIDNKDPVETKNDLRIDKIKHSAVTAISAAAVKAKILANQEEDQIRQLATLLIEKQLHKLETKLAFFSEMDSVVMRVRELLERSKQRLYQERAQIIAARLGVSASSSRPMAESLPVNRAAMHFANSTPRPLGSNAFQRPPVSRPVIASALTTSSTLVSSTVAGNSVQPSNHSNFSSVGMK